MNFNNLKLLLHKIAEQYKISPNNKAIEALYTLIIYNIHTVKNTNLSLNTEICNIKDLLCNRNEEDHLFNSLVYFLIKDYNNAKKMFPAFKFKKIWTKEYEELKQFYEELLDIIEKLNDPNQTIIVLFLQQNTQNLINIHMPFIQITIIKS